MDSIRIELFNGKVFRIDNVGSCFFVYRDDIYKPIGHYNSLKKAIEFCVNIELT